MTNQENALKVIRYIQDNVEGLKGGYHTINGISYLEAGKEPQLNHLLLAIQPEIFWAEIYIENDRTILIIDEGGSLNTQKEDFDYDLTKTVEENLESNESLTNYLINLFGL